MHNVKKIGKWLLSILGIVVFVLVQLPILGYPWNTLGSGDPVLNAKIYFREIRKRNSFISPLIISVPAVSIVASETGVTRRIIQKLPYLSDWQKKTLSGSLNRALRANATIACLDIPLGRDVSVAKPSELMAPSPLRDENYFENEDGQAHSGDRTSNDYVDRSVCYCTLLPAFSAATDNAIRIGTYMALDLGAPVLADHVPCLQNVGTYLSKIDERIDAEPGTSKNFITGLATMGIYWLAQYIKRPY